MSVEKLRNANGSITAKNESKTLAKENYDRSLIIISNVGAKTVYVSLSTKAEAEKGIPLRAETGQVYIGEEYTGEITCITKEGESLVLYCEG